MVGTEGPNWAGAVVRGVTADGGTGLVIAGGRSTRFGDREKALAEVAGQSMLWRVVTALGAVTGEVVVNCRPDQRAGFAAALDGVDTEVRFALDNETDEGPLAGLRTGLAAVDTEFAVVLGCDMPLSEPAALNPLLDSIGPADDAVVPTTAGGPEPLHAVYRVEPVLAAAAETLGDDERSLRSVLDRLQIQEVRVGDGPVRRQSVTSVDTTAELKRAEKRLQEPE